MSKYKESEVIIQLMLPIALFSTPVIIIFSAALLYIDLILFEGSKEGLQEFITILLILSCCGLFSYFYAVRKHSYFSKSKYKKHVFTFILVPTFISGFWIKDLYKHKKLFYEEKRLQKIEQLKVEKE